MKKLLLTLAAIVLLTPLAATAQNAALTDFCVQGGTPAAVSGLPSTNRMQGIVPSCTVTIYLTGTLTKATIFSDIGGTPLSNPFTANALGSNAPGQWLAYAAKGSAYDVVLSGGIPPNTYLHPVTITGLQNGGGGEEGARPLHNSLYSSPLLERLPSLPTRTSPSTPRPTH